LLSGGRAGQAWQALAEGDAVSSRDLLLALPGMQAVLEPRPQSVALKLWGNLPALSPFPGLESAAVVHDSRAYDLDFTLVRGRVVLTNRKAKGAARVWVRLPDEAWQLTLSEPGAEVALELYGRWPQGTSFSKQPRPEDRPTQVVGLLVLGGHVGLKTEGQELGLSAPPGPAYYHWDSVAGATEGPQRRDRLPPWADPKVAPPAEAGAVAAVVRAYQARLKERGPEAALLDLLATADRDKDKARAKLARQFVVFGLAALDEVARVAEALADAEHADVRDTATVALRHWIGAGAGLDLELYQVLIERLRYRPAEASSVLQLLHSPFAADQAETYETLVAYLRHGKLAVRSLAWWHLSRLAPADLGVRYDPAGPEAERARARAALEKLIADGKLPPKGKEK
jgi:hypothetical protein